ncbi:MAG: carbohydrate porin [Bacteroidales bacterium]|nr:carbohydrate porin [Bacteroidales bacterium]MBN2818057.1 carbohydrate porin [Bacteroidales bacterium]
MKQLIQITAISFLLPFMPISLHAQDTKNAFLIEGDLVGEFIHIFKGGIQTNELDYQGLEQFKLYFDTENAGFWKGGSIHLHVLNTHGQEVSANYTGDLQVFSNIESPSHTGIFEFIYSQQFIWLELRTGWNDLNAQYCKSEFGSLFINSSFGITPGIALNVPVSIFPLTAPFLEINFNRNKNSSIGIAGYAGNPGDLVSNKYNLDWELTCNNGMLNIIQYKYHSGTEKLLSVNAGLYNHTENFVSFKDSLKAYTGNFGFFVNADKTFIASNEHFENELNGFLQFSLAPDDRNLVDFYLGTGISYHGFFNTKNVSDIVGFGIAHMSTSKSWQEQASEHKKSETAIEFTYQLCLKDRITFQPDLQYIINPGAGTNGDIDNALAGTLRFIVSY